MDRNTAYELDRPSERPYEISGRHTWCLPGVRCPECLQTWANTGTEYPSIALESLEDEESFRNCRPVDLSDYLAKRGRLQKFIAREISLSPGAKFGSFRGKAVGTPRDALFYLGTMFLRETVFRRACDEGLRFSGSSEPDFGENSAFRDYVELQIEPLGELHPSSFSAQDPLCESCGRVNRVMNAPVLVDTSVPGNVDVYRAANFTTYIFVSDAFAKFARRMELTGAILRSVQTA